MEKAFVVDVPQGWTVKGGLFRLGYSDQRPMVDLVSPDGSVKYGSATFRFRPTPCRNNSTSARAKSTIWVRRSRWSWSTIVPVRNSRSCIRKRASRQCAATRRRICRIPNSRCGLSARRCNHDAKLRGQTAFLYCDTGTAARVAYAYTRTTLAGKIWQALTVVSFFAPPDQVSTVRDIVTHCVQSFHVNAEWLEYQKRMGRRRPSVPAHPPAGTPCRPAESDAAVLGKMQAMQNQVNAFERRQECPGRAGRKFHQRSSWHHADDGPVDRRKSPGVDGSEQQLLGEWDRASGEFHFGARARLETAADQLIRSGKVLDFGIFLPRNGRNLTIYFEPWKTAAQGALNSGPVTAEAVTHIEISCTLVGPG